MKRFVLFSDFLGVYLGSAMGFGFWSKLDPVGQDHACSFDSREETIRFLSTWKHIPKSLEARELEVASPDGYVSIDECVAAGIPRWSPNP